jgi:5-methylcytosine-specific restriction endonuclease McrA
MNRKEKAELRTEWEDRFLEKIEGIHKRNKDQVVAKILKRVDTTRSGLATRSKKHGVECNVTVEELRELVYESYGKKCKYCDKILTIKTFVVDHIIPISKNGSSNIDNLQIICKTSNSMKGSLPETQFHMLLDWLETVPEELKKDISIRLARGIH